MSDTMIRIVLVGGTLLCVAAVAIGWMITGWSKADMLDTEEDLADREKMLNGVERDFYDHAAQRVERGGPVFPPSTLDPWA